ncbi:hypothetical protein LCGC14_2820360, partial [marine sediment metagenome]
VRARPEKLKWKVGEQPTFAVDIRNRGKRDLWLNPIAGRVSLQCQGKLYTPRGSWFSRYSPNYVPAAAGRQASDVPVPYRERHMGRQKGWRWVSRDHKPLALGPGKHQVRMAVTLVTRGREPIITVISNPVVIEILPAKPADAGRAKLDFLQGLPEFHELDLTITEARLKAMIAEKGLLVRVNQGRGLRSYHVYRQDGEHVIVMFRDGKCAGVQRMRKDPATAARLAAKPADAASAWGKPAAGLAMRLSAPAPAVYRHGRSLPLTVQLKNVSAGPVAVQKLGWYADAGVTDSAGRRLIVRQPASLGPWKTRKGPLRSGEVLEWTARFETLRFAQPPKAGQTVRIRFRVVTRGQARPGAGRTPPLIEIFSNPITLTLRDVPPSKMTAADAPKRWRQSMSYAYREDMG